MNQVKPLKSNTCAIIITHNPDTGFHIRSAKIAAQVNKLIIVDNGSSPGSINILQKSSVRLDAVLLLNPKNMGIATALNQGMSWAHKNCYLWAITYDQDTIVKDALFEIYQSTYSEISIIHKIAIIGSNYFDINSCRYHLQIQSNYDCSWIEQKTVITSGSLISLEAYQEIGPFRENFFIDLVDIEYCLRARTKGFRLFLTLEPTMDHAIGKVKIHNIAGLRLGTTNHNPARRYYMARNHIILVKEYFLTEPLWVISTLYSRLKSILLICFFEDNKVTKLKLTLLGIIDGVFNKFNRNLTHYV